MARPLRIQYPGALYHVTNRGNERKAIFKDDADRQAFLRILSQSLETYGIVLHSFVLMKNHWHLLAQTPLGNLSEFMRHFNVSYTSHYNRRHNRSGHLYQGRYKSFLIEMDAYLAQVSRYIHLNPVRVAGLKKKPVKQQLEYLRLYRWSSLPGFLSLQKRLEFVEYATVLGDYGGDNRTGRQRYRKQITEDLGADFDIKKQIVGQSILGREGYVSWVRRTFLDSEKDRERPEVKKIHQYLSKEVVLSVVEEEVGVKSALESTGSVRQIVMSALYRYAGLNNREIGNLLGVDYSTVSQGRKRLRDKTIKDWKIRGIFQSIEKKLSRIKI